MTENTAPEKKPHDSATCLGCMIAAALNAKYPDGLAAEEAPETLHYLAKVAANIVAHFPQHRSYFIRSFNDQLIREQAELIAEALFGVEPASDEAARDPSTPVH